MTALATQTSSKRRLLLASDSNDNAGWALGATDTISRPFDRQGILQRIRSAFPDTVSFDATGSGKALNKGIAAVQAVTVKMYEKLPAGTPSASATSSRPKTKFSARSSKPPREWLNTFGRHHTARLPSFQ